MPKVDRSEFVAEFMGALRHHAPGRSFEYVESEFLIRTGDGGFIGLGNIFASWQQTMDPEQRRQIIQNMLSVSTAGPEMPESFEDVRQRLLPKLRHGSTMGLSALTAELQGSAIPKIPEWSLGDHVRMTLVYDGDTFMMDVTEDCVSKWQRPADELLALAVENLKTRQEPFTTVGPGVFLAARHDGYDSSRILLTEAIAKFELRGRPLAFVVNRDVLVITGDEDPEGHKTARAVVQKASGLPYPISVVPLVYDFGRWRTHRLPRETKMGRHFELLRLQEQHSDYKAQKDLLEKLAVPRREEAYVASLMLMADKEHGGFASYTVWTEGIPILLAVADKVAFVRGPPPTGFFKRLFFMFKAPAATVRFEEVRRVVGHRMTKLDIFPARYRVESFPTSEELAAMGVGLNPS